MELKCSESLEEEETAHRIGRSMVLFMHKKRGAPLRFIWWKKVVGSKSRKKLNGCVSHRAKAVGEERDRGRDKVAEERDRSREKPSWVLWFISPSGKESGIQR